MTGTDAPRRLSRSRFDRVVAGVAGGFGTYLGIDPVVIRLALVLLTLVGGLGALLYLAAWLIVPEDAGEGPEGAGGTGGVAGAASGARIAPAWLIVLALVALVLLGGIGRIGFGIRTSVVWPLVLIVFGVAALWLRSNRRAPARPATEAVAQTEPAAAGTDPDRTAPRPVVVASPLRRAAPALTRVFIALVGAGLALVIAILVVLLVEGPVEATVTPVEFLVAAVILVALAVWGGQRLRRVPDLLLVALASILVLGAAAWLRPPLRGGFGTRDVQPASTRSLDHSYRLAGGRLQVDLGAVRLGSRPRSLSASVSIGRLAVIVSDDVTVKLDGHVGAGELCAFGRRDGGTGIDRNATMAGTSGVLMLHLRVGAGALLVARDADRATLDCPHHLDHLGAENARPEPVAPPAPVAPEPTR